MTLPAMRLPKPTSHPYDADDVIDAWDSGYFTGHAKGELEGRRQRVEIARWSCRLQGVVVGFFILLGLHALSVWMGRWP